MVQLRKRVLRSFFVIFIAIKSFGLTNDQNKVLIGKIISTNTQLIYSFYYSVDDENNFYEQDSELISFKDYSLQNCKSEIEKLRGGDMAVNQAAWFILTLYMLN
jgi:hypothetical protein